MNASAQTNYQVGSEVSILHGGRRRRGWIAEQEDNLVVRLYPTETEKVDHEVQAPRQIRVLKRQTPPDGWHRIDFASQKEPVWISLRFEDHFMEALQARAKANGKGPEETLIDYIYQGLDMADQT